MKKIKSSLVPFLLCQTISVSFTPSFSYAEDATAKPVPFAAKVKVSSTIDSGGYTYIEFKDGDKSKWLAGPLTAVKVGDEVEYGQAMPMTNFTSKTLKKTFDTILFVSSIKVISSKTNSVKIESTGTTIQDCYSKRDALSGKSVSIQGKIVKLTTGVMGKTWLHLEDGSGNSSNNDSDLAVTTKKKLDAKIGDVVTVSGKLSKDVDLGAGYFFKVLVEDAKVTVQK